MKSVLISVQPKWCEKITRIIGQKNNVPIYRKSVEIRKTKPKLETPFKCYIYCTAKEPSLWTGNVEDWGVVDARSNGKVIAEFICDGIQEYECEFVDDDCYENIASLDHDEDGDVTGFIEWSNDDDIPFVNTDFYQKTCVNYKELKRYMGFGINQFYGWHISDLVIYDKPKELSEFFIYCGDNPKCDGCEAHYYSNTESGKEEYCCSIIDGHRPLKRPPQSWCYVEGVEGK